MSIHSVDSLKHAEEKGAAVILSYLDVLDYNYLRGKLSVAQHKTWISFALVATLIFRRLVMLHYFYLQLKDGGNDFDKLAAFTYTVDGFIISIAIQSTVYKRFRKMSELTKNVLQFSISF